MFIAETTMTAPVDFASRFVGNFTQNIVALKSSPYISTIDKNINAKSILGLLSADIRKGDIIRIQTISNASYEQAESDLNLITELINNEIKWGKIWWILKVQFHLMNFIQL